MVPDRKALITRCRKDLELRRSDYIRELASLDEAASRETKSSAGDKYETGREMIAQGRNLVLHNLSETDANLETLDRMAAAPTAPAAPTTTAAPAAPAASAAFVAPVVTFGSLVETSLGWYLVGASLGEVEWEGTVVRTLTLGSPLGQALRGRAGGDKVAWRGKDLVILRILT